MLLITQKFLAVILVTASSVASGQATLPSPAFSPTQRMVQAMGVAPTLQADIKKSLADPAYLQRINSQEIALGQKMASLSESTFNALIAKILEAGLSSSDITIITDFYQSKLGQTLYEHSKQATSLPQFNAQLSASDRQAMEKYAASGVISRAIQFLESKKFQRALVAELAALPDSPRP